ncbi:MAG: hypothetical protein U0Q11_15855 [Vicinamibacterales bacterium]
MIKVLFTDGTPAMLVYRAMQWARAYRLLPLELFFNKVNVIFCGVIIGRGAEFGPALVFVHSHGIVINGRVSGGHHVYIEHQVTIGAERGETPTIGDHVYIGAGAKVLASIGSHCRVGANAVVKDVVPEFSTAVGVPARLVRKGERRPGPGADRPPDGGTPTSDQEE